MKPSQPETDSGLTGAVSISNTPIVFRVHSRGSVRQPRLEYTLISNKPVSRQLEQLAADRINFFLSLDDDLGPFYKTASADPQFAPILQRFYGFHQVKFLTPFECACWAVLSQHNLMMLAKRTKDALARTFGSGLEIDGKLYPCFPEPFQLASASRDQLDHVVRNTRRADYLANVGREFAKVDDGFLRRGDYDKVDAWLQNIKGIGEWSARLIMLRGLGRMEQLAVEKRLLQAATKVYAKKRTLTEQELSNLAEKYGPWKGYWAYYLRAAFLG